MKSDFNKLPSGWKLKTLGEIAEVVGGGTPSTRDTANFGGSIPWLTPADLSGYTSKYISHGERFITEHGLRTSSAKMMPARTVLFTSRAPIGYVAIASTSLCTNQGFKSFVLKEGVLPDYVYWWLKGNKELAESFASGTTFLELSGTKAKQLPIPIPPTTEEQEKIVAEIEKQFSRLDEAVTALKRIQANLKRYKAAVLKAAVEGVGKDWWQPIQNTIRTLEQGWSPQCEREAAQDSETWAVIKTTAVQAGSFLECENKKLPEKLQPRPNLEIQKDDLLITRAGPRGRVGVTCLVRSTRHRLILCDKVYRLRCNKQVVRPDYLELVLNAPQIVDALDELKTGISDSGVNLTQVRFNKLLVPLPSLKEQKAAVEEMERLLSVTEELETTTETNLKRAERLRQTILQKAFIGDMANEPK